MEWTNLLADTKLVWANLLLAVTKLEGTNSLLVVGGH